VRQVESLVALRTVEPSEKEGGERGAQDPIPMCAAAVLEMERTLGTRVKVHGDEKRGKIEISYFFRGRPESDLRIDVKKQ